MTSAPVAQLATLSGLFGSALAACRPESVAILGVAGGNGLEHVDPAVTRRVRGVDINPQFLLAARARFPKLETYCADLSAGAVAMEPVALVHAALVLEHAGTGQCLDNAVNLVAPGGWLSVVLQLPSATEQGVGGSPPASIQALREGFRLIDPAELVAKLEGRGLRLASEERRAVASGKGLWMGLFRRDGG